MMEKKAIILHDTDNVATAVNELEQGGVVQVGTTSLHVVEDVPFGHKVALTAIARGAPVIKYGETIGVALGDIAAGGWVHVHNVESQRGRGDLPEERG